MSAVRTRKKYLKNAISKSAVRGRESRISVEYAIAGGAPALALTALSGTSFRLLFPTNQKQETSPIVIEM